MIRAVIVEDEPLLAELLVDSLRDHAEVNVVASVRSGREALALVEPQNIDVAVVDIDLGPGPDGVEVARTWRQVNPSVGLVFMTHLIEPTALLLGRGLAYLPKRRATSIDALVMCMQAAVAGEVMVDTEIAASLSASAPGLALLSAHQQRILRSIASGASNKKIAADLGVSVKSVENATASALRALGIDGTDDDVNVRVMAALTYLRLAARPV
jgi:DNA-binding NarL/FixJ family response regulator